jgi:hypothetical protein
LILGDLYISRKNTENAYLNFEQSIIHRKYLEHLFEKFQYLCTKTASIKTIDRKAFNTSSVYFTTRQLTAITELHLLFYFEPLGRSILFLFIYIYINKKKSRMDRTDHPCGCKGEGPGGEEK